MIILEQRAPKIIKKEHGAEENSKKENGAIKKSWSKRKN